MIASEILVKGVEQGIISAEQAERLRALEHVREPPESTASPDDEQLRFIGGFSDIFVTIGLAMFLGAIGYFSLQAGGKLGIGQAGFSDMTTPFTILTLGAFVLLLSAGWRALRAGILGIVPSALTRRLPQPGLSTA